jgi:ATP-binding cassette subfamily B (MDR/TAP) protein 1
MSHGIHLSKTQCPSTTDERERMSRILFVSAIGSIIYAMICTRPDISYAHIVTNRYQYDPVRVTRHWLKMFLSI